MAYTVEATDEFMQGLERLDKPLKERVQKILEKLKEIDPKNSSYYVENAKVFVSRLDEKIGEWKKLCGFCKGQEIISYHDDIAYFADFLGLKAEQFIEPKPGIPPTPKHLEFLEEYVKTNHIKAISYQIRLKNYGNIRLSNSR